MKSPKRKPRFLGEFVVVVCSNDKIEQKYVGSIEVAAGPKILFIETSGEKRLVSIAKGGERSVVLSFEDTDKHWRSITFNDKSTSQESRFTVEYSWGDEPEGKTLLCTNEIVMFLTWLLYEQ